MWSKAIVAEEADVKVIVAGGTGLIGRQLVAELRGAGHEGVVLSRSAGDARWDGRSVEPAVLAGAAAVVNLAGASIGTRRWTRRRKVEILASRVDSTSALVQAIGRLPAAERPSVLVSSSGIDYAGDAGDALVTEDAVAGDSFLASVCV